ncbi:ubiquitin carboxyl-terminal hydrolase 2-like [Elysia marginata]|uniref:Ubiquitin carboxyl-terminal hydrolase n=1 Tax=Elysia marginata TaxID=1093978 RepID=A0AAV4JE88_9GAST|nr:ubiquitin carboxyl-terminal hydrolase 2-like [Elysia marginata]
MPVSSTTSRYGGFSTTYSTSFGSSAASIPRASSGGKSGLTNGYSHTSNYRSRALPSGPGPLDPQGRKLSSYNVGGGNSSPANYEVRRNRTPNRVGPLKADHTTSFAVGVGSTSSSRYLSDHGRAGGYTSGSNYRSTSTLSRPLAPTYRRTSTSSNGAYGYETGGRGDDIEATLRPLSGIRPRKSSSLADLSNLSINSNTSSNRNRPAAEGTDRLYNDRTYGVGERAAGSSSRNSGGYHDDIFGPGRTSGLGGGGASYLDRERPDGTSRVRYTPSMSRETSPTNPVALRRGVAAVLAGEAGESPTKSSMSNQSSSSSVSNGSSCSHQHSHSSRSGSSGMDSPSASHAAPSRYYAVNVKYKYGGKVGLRNLGNTCFMNSVLQCLSNTRQLLDYCLDEKYHSEINTTTSNMKGSLFKAYAQLMQSMWREKSETSVSPNAFKTQIQKFAPRFMGYAQQDSQEFLRYLLEGLHEDVNRVTKKTAPIILDDDALDKKRLGLDKKSDSGKAQDYWKAYLNRDNSLIVDIFVGQLKSELHFSPCRHRSVTFDPFWDLSLSIPKASGLDNRSEVNLEDCIKLFMKEEELAAEERPMCAKCKTRQSCTKSFSIQRFPQILVLHLKRFSQERFGRKLSTLVDFPPNKLDLTEYAAESSGQGSRPVLYDLYAVSNHSGSTSSGHYTAYCKNPYSSDWSFFNDARVSNTMSNQVVSSEAYVLFYELRS